MEYNSIVEPVLSLKETLDSIPGPSRVEKEETERERDRAQVNGDRWGHSRGMAEMACVCHCGESTGKEGLTLRPRVARTVNAAPFSLNTTQLVIQLCL